MKHNQYEAMEQIKLFNWINFMCAKYPDFESAYHIPNGGSRNRIEAANLKKQGVRAGVPDICLPVSSGKYHGLYIEMKYGTNKPTEKQIKWLTRLHKNGYAVKVCYSWKEAANTMCRYLNINYTV